MKTTPLPPLEKARRWSAQETERLRHLWVAQPPDRLASLLGRSEDSVVCKARSMGLGNSEARLKTLRAIERETGYSYERLRSALRKLWPGGGIKAVRLSTYKRLSMESTKRSPWRWALDEIQEQRLLEFLKARPDGEPIFRDLKGAGRTTKGVWGVGRKPKECRVCASDLKPHYAKGLCGPCYQSAFKATKRGGK